MEKGFSRRVKGAALWAVLVSVSVAVLFSVSVSVSASNEKSKIRKASVQDKHVPGEMIVKLKPSLSAMAYKTAIRSLTASLENQMGGNSVLAVEQFQTDSSMVKVRIAKDAQLSAAISAVENDPSVVYAEPNVIFHTLGERDDHPQLPLPIFGDLPNDPELPKLWGMQNTGQPDSAGQVGTAGSDIRIVPVWKDGFVGSKKIVVAVIDTGVAWDHPDLVDNLYTNPNEIPDNGKDDDGNGFVDDIHGWNFVKNSKASADDHAHGSHCAGTIGGVGNNGVGVVGVNWHVSIMPVKFLSAQGSGSLQGAVESINYARMMKVNIMSNSWGGGGFTRSLFDAITAAKDAGILFVAAAGNESANNDSDPHYPAAYDIDNVLAVAATDNQDKLASFSNYGRKSVHVSAPGVKVFSTVLNGKYETFSGTSMACPHVAGIAALLYSVDPSMTYADVKKRLIDTCDPVQRLSRKVACRGRVNAFNAVKNIVPPSDEPKESDWIDVPQSYESKHPYSDKFQDSFTVKVDGAKGLRLHFEKVDTEPDFDLITLESPSGEVIEKISGSLTDYYTDYIKADTLIVRFTSDDSVNGWGFKVDKVQMLK